MSRKYLIDRLHEPSTWRGIVAVATAIAAGMGLSVSAEAGVEIAAAGLAVMGVLGALVPDRFAPTETRDPVDAPDYVPSPWERDE